MKRFFEKIKQAGIKKRIYILLVIILAVAVGGFVFSKVGKKGEALASNFSSAIVKRGDIAEKISGSGTVEPISRYEIISLVKGEILSCDFEEGDFVNEGDILYRIDSTDLQNTIQRQQNSINKTLLTAKDNAQNIQDLKVKAPASGILTDFDIKAGDTFKADKAGTIIDNDTFTATVPFNASQISKINIGDRADIVSALYMTKMEGTVTYKSNTPKSTSNGSILYDVEITLKNPGAVSGGISVGATVHTASGDVQSPESGALNNSKTTPVIPKVSGKVINVYVRNNQYVNKGDILFQIDDTEYRQAQEKTNLELEDLYLSLQTYNKQLENYNIKAPINGVVISKKYKAGDTIGNSQGSDASLMVIADTSKMVFNLEVDELEISKIELGQTANITADALPDETFTGEVTKIANEGTSQNGVTTYKVELTITEPGNLISGMNVNAEIIVRESKDALLVPVSAVSNIKNGEGTVLIKKNARGTDNQETQDKGNVKGPQARPNGSMPANRQAPNAKMPAAQNVEYMPLKVKTGISDSDNIEILSGLNEGDEIFFAAAPTSATNNNSFRGGMPPMGGGSFGGAGGSIRIQRR